MSRKRRQRSTAIRKRIEKKQREEQKARKKAAKLAGREDALRVRVRLGRDAAGRAIAGVNALAKRLAAEPLRGWTPSDLDEDHGLNYLRDVLEGVLEEHPADPLAVDIPESAKRDLLDRLEGLEMAAPGLKVDYDAEFGAVTRALSQAVELEPDEDDEEGVE